MVKSMTAAAVTLLALGGCTNLDQNKDTIKFYAMNCGTIAVEDMGMFSDEGKLDGDQYTFVVPCYLIRHPKGDLIWDTGLGDELVDMPDGAKQPNFHYKKQHKLSDLLKQLALTPKDIEYVSHSHYHPDHSGSSNWFEGSTLIVSQKEHKHMFSDQIKASGMAEGYSKLETAKTVTFTDEYDVFGDGTVVMTFMPGHTPGHSVLSLNLPNSGPMMLSGDLYVHGKSREVGAVPSHSFDKQAVRDSIVKFEAMAQQQNAKVLVQHDMAQFNALPVFPAYLD